MDVLNLTKITIAWELFESGVPKTHIARRLNLNRETVHIWIKGINEFGLLEFLDKYTNSKKDERTKRKIDGLLKARVCKLRRDNRDCCGQKIKEFLEDDYGIKLSVTTIYKILSYEFKLRSKWKKNQPRGPVPKANKPREVIQMDSVDFGDIFAFCAVDICSRETDVILRPSLTAKDGQQFLRVCMARRFNNFSQLIQTDGGSEFKAEFKHEVGKYCTRHRYARPYKKNEQAYIESFNRSLRKECLGWGKYLKQEIPSLQREVDDYLVYYHERRPHMGLNMMTPNRFLKEYQVSDF